MTGIAGCGGEGARSPIAVLRRRMIDLQRNLPAFDSHENPALPRRTEVANLRARS